MSDIDYGAAKDWARDWLMLDAQDNAADLRNQNAARALLALLAQEEGWDAVARDHTAIAERWRHADTENVRLRAALEPFAHPDLCRPLGGNMVGGDSPVFGRNDALLTLADFQRARAALHPEETPMTCDLCGREPCVCGKHLWATP